MNIKSVLIGISKWLAGALITLTIPATCNQTGYVVGLSKNISVTPEHQSGFFVPYVMPAAQAGIVSGANVDSYTKQQQSDYDEMTLQDKPITVNMWGSSHVSKVNPFTLNFRATSEDTETIGGIPHA